MPVLQLAATMLAVVEVGCDHASLDLVALAVNVLAVIVLIVIMFACSRTDQTVTVQGWLNDCLSHAD